MAPLKKKYNPIKNKTKGYTYGNIVAVTMKPATRKKGMLNINLA